MNIPEQTSDCMELVFEMPDIIDLRDRGMLSRPDKVHRMTDFLRTFPVFIERITVKDRWTDEELKGESYFEYLINNHRRGDIHSCSRGLARKVLGKMRYIIALYNDIKDYGIKAPLDIYRTAPNSQRLVLGRGNRCLEIMHQLGYKKVACLLFATPQIYTKNLSSPMPLGPSGVHNENHVKD